MMIKIILSLFSVAMVVPWLFIILLPIILVVGAILFGLYYFISGFILFAERVKKKRANETQKNLSEVLDLTAHPA